MENITISNPGQATVAKLLVSEVNLFNTPAIKQELEVHLNPLPSHFIFDMGDVAYIDSTGIGMVIHMQQKIKRAGGKCYMVKVQPAVHKVLKMTHIDKLLQICGEVDEIPATLAA